MTKLYICRIIIDSMKSKVLSFIHIVLSFKYHISGLGFRVLDFDSKVSNFKPTL